MFDASPSQCITCFPPLGGPATALSDVWRAGVEGRWRAAARSAAPTSIGWRVRAGGLMLVSRMDRRQSKGFACLLHEENARAMRGLGVPSHGRHRYLPHFVRHRERWVVEARFGAIGATRAPVVKRRQGNEHALRARHERAICRIDEDPELERAFLEQIGSQDVACGRRSWSTRSNSLPNRSAR